MKEPVAHYYHINGIMTDDRIFVSLCAGQLCGEGWHHVGEACLRINSSRESYDNTQHYCKNLGGNIASLLTDKQVNFVLEELQKYQLQEKVGGRKDYDDALN